MSAGVEVLEADAQLGAAVDEAIGAGPDQAMDGFMPFSSPGTFEATEHIGWQVAQRLQAAETSPVRDVLNASGVVAPWAGSMGSAVAANAERSRRNF